MKITPVQYRWLNSMGQVVGQGGLWLKTSSLDLSSKYPIITLVRPIFPATIRIRWSLGQSDVFSTRRIAFVMLNKELLLLNFWPIGHGIFRQGICSITFIFSIK
ncbi:MAG: hypothetical protein R2787_12295 [Saprospiraceae bacterium]